MRTILGLLVFSVMIGAVACATGPPAAPGVDVTGNWAGTWSFENPTLGGGSVTGVFQQSGSKLSGRFEVQGPNILNHVSQINGYVSGSEVKLTEPALGYFTVTGSQMSGTVNGVVGTIKMTLSRK
jgi:hypothetical protein